MNLNASLHTNLYMNYCMYLRKSRADIEAEERGEGETLARHRKALLELAKRLHIIVTKEYAEVVSGDTIAARPVMQQLLEDVEQGKWNGVLVMEVERLARGDTMDQGLVAQTFKYSNTKIITPMKIYDPNNEYDEEYFEFGLFMSRREYKTINRRLQRGRIASVKEGKYVGNIPPYGYTRKKLENEKGYTLIPNPEQAPVVRMIFELYTKGEKQKDGTYERLGSGLIVRKLNELKIPTMKGGTWAPSTILGILRNPVYTSKIRWDSRPEIKTLVEGEIKKRRPRAKPEDWTLVDGLHEAIIDNDTWETAQEYLNSNPSRPCPSNETIKNPLSGLVKCGMCGRNMIRRPYNGKPDTLMCPSTACKNISTHLVYVEERLLKSLEGWLYNYKLSWGINDKSINLLSAQQDIKKKALKKVEDELKTFEKQRDNIYDLLEQGIYSTDKFFERSRILTDKINEAQAYREKLLNELHQEKLREESQKKIIPKVEKVLELYKSTEDPAIKNELLKEVINKAVYTKTVDGRNHNNRPDDFQLVLYPKLAK